MKKRISLILLVLVGFSANTSNWKGYSLQERKQKQIENHIRYLKQKYPPNKWDWVYDISKNQKPCKYANF